MRNNASSRIKKSFNNIYLVGAYAVALASLGVMVCNDNNVAERRDSYFSKLPTEIVMATDKTLLGMMDRVTSGLPEEKRPTRSEFKEHALKNNTEFSYNDLSSKFGGKVGELKLPDYNGKFDF